MNVIEHTTFRPRKSYDHLRISRKKKSGGATTSLGENYTSNILG